MDEGTTSNLATLRDFKEGLESLLRELREVIKDNQGNDRNLQIPCYAFQSSCYNSYIENNLMFSDTLNELKIEESKDVHKLFEKMPVNKLLTDCARDFVEKKMADGKLCIIFKEAFAPYVADDDSSVAKAQQVVVVGGGYNGGICRDLWHFEGQEDEYKSCKVAAYTYVHSSDKSSNCDDEWYMHEEGSGKGLIGEEEMNINEKHKEELNKVTTSTVYMVSETRNSPLVLRTTDICKLEMIRLGVRIKKKLV
ncbi:hypothetical protein Tco_0778078 [Tanacetum coccineum]